MLITKKSELAPALGLVGSIVERRNTIPILSNLAIERTDGGLRARMTDLDIEAEIEFAGALDTSFKPFTVPANLLRDIISKLPESVDIQFHAGDDSDTPGTIYIKCGRSKFTLQSLPVADLATMNLGTLSNCITISSKQLLAAIGAVSFAISTEETRYYLNGIFMHPTETGMMFVATDGHRLAKRFVPIENAHLVAGGVIIPRKTIAALTKVLPKDGDISIEWNENKIVFSLPSTKILSKLIDGQFPDYQRVIPQSNSTEVTINGKQLAAAVERVQLISTERGRAMRFRFEESGLTLTVNNPDAGAAEEQLAFEGQADFETGFNAKYVLDAINHLAEDEIRMALDEPNSPAILRADGDHVENLIVLMPMRV